MCGVDPGYLAGLRDFIETAELERMKVIAEQSPHLFYHILPFAYVFGLTDLLLDKMRIFPCLRRTGMRREVPPRILIII